MCLLGLNAGDTLAKSFLLLVNNVFLLADGV
jgi:hypothetical protein